ncbi:PTS lactose transporter subunit IIB [Collinsella sp. AGMB00827]|uniref:PTS lactose transporter subunit IIB n=1 Tax=Collinsella ureilytica TaxID=2869515 RepID=A0ABS7MKE9_9ACTN|nr:PTS lactose transporter subunit IIB [Collinsella urealyticum]MBY4797762.1 PTS lactose transporter subunit IIB [Collinsella urealyticum]
MEKKTVIVCCASSMITSTMAVSKVKEIADSCGLPEPHIIQCKFSEVQGNLASNDVDFIVSTGKLKGVETGNVPVIKGTAFVTGVGEEEVVREIEAQFES